LLCISNHIIKDEKQHWLTPVFLIKINDGIPVNKELNKHSDMKWFHLNNLPSNLTNCTNDGIKSLKKNFSFDFVSDIHY
jgi:ADP-ribose pyrophosphatase